ncbi:hypothetical protein LTR86_001375 [Recurvomyces mirabilis]|nr:hypothetical protein LTR86_001375 [Recurvomyces mirabilis]
MHSTTIILALALANTLTAAIPHAGSHNHAHMLRHLHARTPAQSNIGECGGDLAFTCGPGYCCSQWGYCGASKEYCDAGCQSAFGTCNSNASTTSAPSVATAVSTVTGSGIGNETTISAGGPSVVVDTTVTIQSTVSFGAAATKAYSHPAWTGPPHRSISAYPSETSSSVAAVSTTSVPAETSTAILSSSAASSTTLQTSYAPAPSSYSAPASSSVSVAAAPSSYSAPAPSSSSAAAPSSYSAPSTSVAPAPTSYSAPPSPTSSAPAATSSASSGGSSAGSDSYKVYSGDGTTGAGWPSQDSWVDFESMWSANMALISISCTQFSQTNNDQTESDDLKSAIQAVASSSGIDERFILAIVMQESKGCVRAPTTNYGVTNPGLMQSHDGAGTCNNAGTVQNPCPASQITQMITDGSTGTSSGDGLKQGIANCGASDVSKYYKAARIYNSGSVATSGNLDDGIATHCYSSDIANRLTGWVKAQTQCTLG